MHKQFIISDNNIDIMKNRQDLWDMFHESKKLGGAHANFLHIMYHNSDLKPN
jgi:hypothetical protein